MKQDFTKLDVLKFVYNENNPSSAKKFKAEMDSNWALREEYKELLAAKKALPKVTFEPSRNTLNNILRHSRKTTLEPSV